MIKRKTFFIPLIIGLFLSFILLSSEQKPGPKEGCKGGGCDRVQEQRAKNMEASGSDRIINQSSKSNHFMKCIMGLIDSIASKRMSDHREILNEIEKIKINKMNKSDQIAMIESLIAPLKTPLSKYNRCHDEKHFNNWYNHYKCCYEKTQCGLLSRRTYTGPGLEMATVLTGQIESSDGIFLTIYLKSGLDILKEQENPIQYLIERMQSQDYSISPSPLINNFTPGISKIILFELLREKHHLDSQKTQKYMEDFNIFARRIHLKMKTPDDNFAHNHFKRRFQYSIHDGFFYGAQKENMVSMNNIGDSLSFDCSSFIQYCAFGIESFSPYENGENKKGDKTFRITTNHFVQTAKKQKSRPSSFDIEFAAYQNLDRSFNFERLYCESQLRPGDMVVYLGHIFIFIGYKVDSSGKIRLHSIEASGNENRTVGAFTREIYEEKCHKYSFARDDDIKGKEEREAFIVRFKE
ncbi:MAG: hypothetical protein OXB88_01560 [Bacteriovoracales bacterium]|nr:hypothetical protein [Bacteriovoracales bacterium]